MDCLEIVHIHGFKCAGTTFAASLAANYLDQFRCIEPLADEYLDWSKALNKANELELKAISSHLLRIPVQLPFKSFFVYLIRKPHERLVSAWKFEKDHQHVVNESFSEYLSDLTRCSNKQSRTLLSDVSPEELNSMLTRSSYSELFKHRSNLFIGLVERYEESMTLLELILRQKSIAIDLSFPMVLNKYEKHDSESVPDCEVPNPLVVHDNALYDLANSRLDFYISMFPEFERNLRNYKARCRSFTDNLEEYKSRIYNDNWYYIV
jgi:hypothetical protein